MRFLRTLAVLAIITTTFITIAAQVRVDVRLVNVIATVTDARGRYIAGLGPEDFILEADGRAQKISHFTEDRNVPVSVGIVLDTSGSMERKIRTAVDAVDRFIRQTDEADEIFLITFSSQPVLRQDFTADREKLAQALRRIPATGGTALYDALNQALDKIRSARHSKRAILVITDGQDTSSAAKLEEVLQKIRMSELLVYPIGISPRTYAGGAQFRLASQRLSQRDEVDFNVLRAFAESSGGRAFLLAESFAGRGTQIDKVLATVADELRSQYTLGFYPDHAEAGRFHSIRIRTRTRGAVRARRGYIF